MKYKVSIRKRCIYCKLIRRNKKLLIKCIQKKHKCRQK